MSDQENLQVAVQPSVVAGSILVNVPSRLVDPTPSLGLTSREREIADHIARGMKNSEIADELFISIDTVKRHLANIYAKTGAKNRVQLVRALYNL